MERNGWDEVCHANINCKKAHIVTLDKVVFKQEVLLVIKKDISEK